MGPLGTPSHSFSSSPASASSSSTSLASADPEDPGCLVDNFNNLHLPDGSVPRRDAESGPGLDALPLELICMLVPHLQPDDFAACVRVSKTWFSIWTFEVVAADILHHCFPGLIQTAKRRGLMPPRLWTLFQLAARKRWRFLCGSHRVARTYPNRMDFIANGEPILHGMIDRGPLYSSGRVAWQHDGRSFVIDDLHANFRTRNFWQGPRSLGDELYLVAMTEKLVIFTKRRNFVHPKMFLIYNISERRTIPLRLRYPVCHLQASGLTVGLHLFKKHLFKKLGHDGVGSPYVWRWGGTLERVRPSQTSRQQVSHFESKDPILTARGFLYHPWDEDIFFVVWTALEPGRPGAGEPSAAINAEHGAESPGQRRGRLAVLVDVYKQTPLGSTPTGNSHVEYDLPPGGATRTALGLLGSWCQETDFHGGHELFTGPRGANHSTLPFTIPSQDVHGPLMFNTVTRRFTEGDRPQFRRPPVSP